MDCPTLAADCEPLLDTLLLANASPLDPEQARHVRIGPRRSLPAQPLVWEAIAEPSYERWMRTESLEVEEAWSAPRRP